MSFTGNLKEGDIVVSLYRNRGYWRVLGFETRIYNGMQYPSNVEVELVMTLEGVVPKKKARKNKMPLNWLNKVTDEGLAIWREADNKKWDKLSELIQVKTSEEIEKELLKQGIITDPEILSQLGPPSSLFKEIENGTSNASQVSQ